MGQPKSEQTIMKTVFFARPYFTIMQSRLDKNDTCAKIMLSSIVNRIFF